jgi:hypothetical protein
MERGSSIDCGISARRPVPMSAGAGDNSGNTNAIAVLTSRSEFCEQDIEQSIRPIISCSQSAYEAGSDF